MPATTVAQATQVIDLLRQDFAQIIFNSPQGDFSCSFSAGIASYPPHVTIESLRAAADQALYRAKRQGRNQTISDKQSQEG
jgi:PleD family two-component response regulator